MCITHSILFCLAQRLLTRVFFLFVPSSRIRLLPQRLDLSLHPLDVAFALAGLPFHRLPALFELPKLTPAHVKLYASLLFLSSCLC